MVKPANIHDPKHPDYIEPITKGTVLDPTHPSFAKGMKLHGDGKLKFTATADEVRTDNPDGTATSTITIARTYNPAQ